jgi:hypothetical protein
MCLSSTEVVVFAAALVAVVALDVSVVLAGFFAFGLALGFVLALLVVVDFLLFVDFDIV